MEGDPPRAGDPRARRDARETILVGVGLFVALLVVYAPALRGGFVWDDDVNVELNGALRSVAGLGRIWGDVTATQQYYPVTHTSFWAQVQTTGLATLPLHVVNVALHATTALLLRAILRRLRVPGATLAVVLFALHPLQVESVAWITERKNVLSGALGLGAVLVYLHADERPPGRRRIGLGAAAFALFLLALGAKTTTSMLAAALAVALVALRKRRPRDLALLAPWLVAGGAAGLGTAILEATRLGASGVEFAWSPAVHLYVAARAFVFYLSKLVWPAGLMFFYPRWTLDVSALEVGSYVGGVVLLFAGAIAARKRAVGPLVALLLYGVLVFPALGVFHVYFMRYAFVQDHFQYLAGMPVFALAGAGLAKLGERWRRADLAIVAVAAVAYGALSWRGAGAFRDYETLFRTALASNPDAWVASYDLGRRLREAHRPIEAAALLLEALRVRPNDPDVLGGAGAALAEGGQVDEAIGLLRGATERRPLQADAWLNLAVGLDLAGKTAESVAAYRETIRLRPGWPRAERQLAWLLATTPEAAVRDGAEAVKLATSACSRTTQAIARCEDTLAAAFAASGDFPNARAHEARAIEALGPSGGPRGEYAAHAALYAENKALVLPRVLPAPATDR